MGPVRSVDAMPTSIQVKDPSVIGHRRSLEDVRPWMLGASIVHMLFSMAIMILGATQYGLCGMNRFGDWGIVYGGLLIGCSIVTVAAIYVRRRMVALVFIFLSCVGCLVALCIDGMSYFCFDLNSGANRSMPRCTRHIKRFNSCAWKKEWKDGYEHYGFEDGWMRLTQLVLIVLNFVFGIGIMTTALTKAGQHDICQIEDALHEFKEVNEKLTYRKRARRNRIIAQYVSKAKPHEGSNYAVKLINFLGFGVDPQPVPIEDRKIKIVLPPPTKAEM